ncbi:hypothetical protein [Bacillus sp. J37]|uniref:hypothetical protein n=1 Tax=Bacillus sp. J37 TaxID=935837 RepID=UPI0004B8D9D4|nr:hypothetical protein [Bacillus sp. J37]
MGLSKRDKAICSDLNRFRCMSLDDIADIHFKGLKKPKNSANNVLKRLYRDGHIKRSTAFQPYVYFGSEVNIKSDSAKIGHFLAIVQVYREMSLFGKFDVFQVEPKYGSKGEVEPDIFCIYNKSPFFIEVQKTIYGQKTMDEKLKRYEKLYDSKIIEKEPWQPKNNKQFPIVLILSEQRFALDDLYSFELFQAVSFSQFLNTLEPQPVKEDFTPKTVKTIEQPTTRTTTQNKPPKRRTQQSQYTQQTYQPIPPNINKDIQTSSNIKVKY